MAVYFIQQGENGPVKIGFADDPQHRLNQLQVGNPERLRLVGTLPGFLADNCSFWGFHAMPTPAQRRCYVSMGDLAASAQGAQ